MFEYRRAVLDDLKALSRFTDLWLSGPGKALDVSGAVDDCFISVGQHRKYIEKYTTWICLDGNTIVGWAVIQHSSVMMGYYKVKRIRSRTRPDIDSIRPIRKPNIEIMKLIK